MPGNWPCCDWRSGQMGLGAVTIMDLSNQGDSFLAKQGSWWQGDGCGVNMLSFSCPDIFQPGLEVMYYLFIISQLFHHYFV